MSYRGHRWDGSRQGSVSIYRFSVNIVTFSLPSFYCRSLSILLYTLQFTPISMPPIVSVPYSILPSYSLGCSILSATFALSYPSTLRLRWYTSTMLRLLILCPSILLLTPLPHIPYYSLLMRAVHFHCDPSSCPIRCPILSSTFSLSYPGLGHYGTCRRTFTTPCYPHPPSSFRCLYTPLFSFVCTSSIVSVALCSLSVSHPVSFSHVTPRILALLA